MRLTSGYREGPTGMCNANEIFLDVGRGSIARALRSMAKPGGLPAFFHCSVGKDRTGLLAMLVLSLVGASDEEIATDYSLTAEFTPPTKEKAEYAKEWMRRA